jgi:hypothetical protein
MRIQPRTRQAATLFVGPLLALATAAVAASAASAAPAGPKYYFQLHEVESRVPIDGEIRRYAGEALRTELASRPEWASDLGGATNKDAVIAELARRKLQGFDVIVKISELKKEVKDPSPGSRLKKLAVTVRLEVLGTTLPGEKMAFGGEGEASAIVEVPERRVDAEADALAKDAIKDALKQAMDQVVLKMGAPKSAPMNEGKRKKKTKT